MKYINLGCGLNYSSQIEWVNFDFIKSSPNVISYNLLKGIPIASDSSDFVYHSHVLEHFNKNDGKKFLSECFRVLKKDGIIRVVVPDLESIIKEYLTLLNFGINNLDDENNKANYDWIMLEMFDQTVRNYTGGDMSRYLKNNHIPNLDFIIKRIGDEASSIIAPKNNRKITIKSVFFSLKHRLPNLINIFRTKYSKIGHFRLQGEIHQWMYDRYSLTILLSEIGFSKIKITNAHDSYLSNWNKYSLDIKNGMPRKPDSLYIEAIK
jgi:predicted SAM-dependent methyltransferase